MAGPLCVRARLAHRVVAPTMEGLAGCRSVNIQINVDDCPLPSSDDLRRQALWLINTARTFKASAESDDPEAVDLWSTTSGLLDGVTTMSPEELVTLLFARSSMAVLLLVRFAELAAEQADIPIGDLFDQVQIGIHDAQLAPPGWDDRSADPSA